MKDGMQFFLLLHMVQVADTLFLLLFTGVNNQTLNLCKKCKSLLLFLFLLNNVEIILNEDEI